MFGKNYVNINGQSLVEYRYSSGGGMLGGYYTLTVKKYDDGQAIINITEAESHNEEPVKKEYLTDLSIISELEREIRAGRMNHWNGKKFTNIFVADGESKSYSFTFDKKRISFSSQLYPPSYSNKLRNLDKIIKKYIT